MRSMAKQKEQTTPDPEVDHGKTTDNPPTTPLHGMSIIGSQVRGKNETRLYQTDPNTKEWLTKEQAEKSGFYWRD